MGIPWDWATDQHAPNPADVNDPNPCGWVVVYRMSPRLNLGVEPEIESLTLRLRILASCPSIERVQDVLLARAWELVEVCAAIMLDPLPCGAVQVQASRQGAVLTPRTSEVQTDRGVYFTGNVWSEFEAMF